MSGGRDPGAALATAARALRGDAADFDPIVESARHARVVLIGEASHGTHDFYRVRAEITRRLISEPGFSAVAVEGDWPDAHRVNEHVRGVGDDADAVGALAGFERFPQWMWRNSDVVDFVTWLRTWNEELPAAQRTGFYGLDLYSLRDSMEAVLRYLHDVDPEAAARARYRYACFDQFGEDPQAYGYAASYRLTASCEREVIAQLVDLRRAAGEYARRDGDVGADQLFFAEQNALVVQNAERYYRSMFESRVSSWNLRDSHMAETLRALAAHLSAQGRRAHIVVWAHNSHVGDMRATEMGRRGEHNVGQLARDHDPDGTLLVGFSTYRGTVTAAHDWDEPAERMQVRDALEGSYEALFHRQGGDFLVDLRNEGLLESLGEPRLQRAIGVVYRPTTERMSHYYHVSLPSQFDFMLHYDETRAVEPLDRGAHWTPGEMPETYPSAL